MFPRVHGAFLGDQQAMWSKQYNGKVSQDRDGAKLVLPILRNWFTRLRCIWADGAYSGPLETWVTGLRRYRKVR
jgi:hypothetical protein